MKLKELFEAFSYNSKLDPVVKLKNFSNISQVIIDMEEHEAYRSL